MNAHQSIFNVDLEDLIDFHIEAVKEHAAIRDLRLLFLQGIDQLNQGVAFHEVIAEVEEGIEKLRQPARDKSVGGEIICIEARQILNTKFEKTDEIIGRGILWAIPMTNTSGDWFEDYLVAIDGISVGDRFAWYQNTGLFMDVYHYNNEPNLSLVESDVIARLNANTSYDTTGFTLVDSTSAVDVDYYDYYGNETSGGTASGTYEVDTSIYSAGIEFYAIKAGDAFALYFEEGGEDYGSWSTYDLWLETGEGASLQISHFIGYNGTGAGRNIQQIE